MSSELTLLNCRQCDDIVQLVDEWRACVCGSCRGRRYDAQTVEYEGHFVRLLSLSWEEYDKAKQSAVLKLRVTYEQVLPTPNPHSFGGDPNAAPKSGGHS